MLPTQYTGEEVDAEASAKLEDKNGARAFYEKAKNLLLIVNACHRIAGRSAQRSQF